MSARLYWTPIAGDGTSIVSAFRVEIPGARCRAPIPVHPRYTPAGDLHPDAGRLRFARTIAVAVADAWGAVDPAHALLLPDLDAATPRALLTRIESLLLGDLDVVHVAHWDAMLEAIGGKRDDLVADLPVINLLRRALLAIDPQGMSVEGFLG